MAEMIACLTGYVKGVGASAGGMPVPASNCINPVTAFIMHGSADTTVPISEGETARDTFLQLNGCSNSSVRTSDDRCDHYNECSSGQDVYWCQHSGGHPGADPNALGLSEAMMDVFQAIP
jgi:poly(3-hydroxybutyrate) depolymerase